VTAAPDAAEALGELARLAEMASALVAQADTMLGRELRGNECVFNAGRSHLSCAAAAG